MLIYIKVIFTIINSFILKFKLKKILQNKRAYPLEIQIKKSSRIKEYIYYNFTKYI